jgi:hypothetical protein
LCDDAWKEKKNGIAIFNLSLNQTIKLYYEKDLEKQWGEKEGQ